MDRLLTLSEVSTLLRSTDRKNRLVKSLYLSGELAGARIGKKLMFKESDVNRYIRKQFS